MFTLTASDIHTIYRQIHRIYPMVEPDIFIDYQVLDKKQRFVFGYDSDEPVPPELVAIIYREKIIRYIKSLPGICLCISGDKEITKCSIIYHDESQKNKVQNKVFQNKIFDVALVDAAWFALEYWKSLHAESNQNNNSES